MSDSILGIIEKQTEIIEVVKGSTPLSEIVVPGPQGPQGIQGEKGDPGLGTAGLVSKVNGEANPLIKGTPVYLSNSTTIRRARADAPATKNVLGFVYDDSIANGGSGNIQTTSIMILTTNEWDAITGSVGGLQPQTDYYLSTITEGRITSVAPGSTGYVCKVGYAISSTEFLIRMEPSIKL
jgi:hypothetical protein